MSHSKDATILLKYVDASNNMKDHKYIYGLLKNVINDVRQENAVQLVMHNELAFMKVRTLLMKRYNKYYTLCVTHCIDLMFENICK